MGLEPTTFELEVQRANLLRHGSCFGNAVSPTFIRFHSILPTFFYSFVYGCCIREKNKSIFSKRSAVCSIISNFLWYSLEYGCCIFCKKLCIFQKKISSSCCLLICSVIKVIWIFMVNIELFQTIPYLKLNH